VEKYYTTLICLKQAIQPGVVGPLFYLRCIDLYKLNLIGIVFGTSIGLRYLRPGALAPGQERLV